MDREAALRARFNPDGSLLRRHQLRMLTLLEEVDRVCKKYAIPYWLSSGTLIGAARHKGFIPWDDDVDIEMLRKDYLRLLQVLPGELSEDFVLQTNTTDPNYTMHFAKLRDRKSFIEEAPGFDHFYSYRGIFIDIFPLERVPYPIAWFAARLQGMVYRQLKKEGSAEQVLGKARKIFRMHVSVLFPFLRFLCRILPGKALRHSLGTNFLKPRYRADIFPLAEMEFEGRMFPVPCQTDRLLRKIYGDYTQLPDLDTIPSHCIHLEFYR